MTLHLVPDDEDDFADRDREDPRLAAGYQSTVEPRGRRRPGAQTYFAIVEREGIAAISALGKICRDCGKEATVLVHHPRRNDPQRDTCGRCAGEARRGMSY